MNKYITITENFVVREVIQADIAAGFLTAPRQDIKVGDTLTEYEKMLCGLIDWDESLIPVAEEPTPQPE